MLASLLENAHTDSVKKPELVTLVMVVRVPTGVRPADFAHKLHGYIDSFCGYRVQEIEAR